MTMEGFMVAFAIALMIRGLCALLGDIQELFDKQ